MSDARLYEGMFLFDSNQTVRRWAELEDRVQQIFQKNEASIEYSERWPDQRLAYEINGVRKGTYFLTYFKAEPGSIQQIRRDTELTEDIVRVLILQEEGLEKEMATRKKAAERRASEPAPAPVEAAPPAPAAAEAAPAAEEAPAAEAVSTDAAPAADAEAEKTEE